MPSVLKVFLPSLFLLCFVSLAALAATTAADR